MHRFLPSPMVPLVLLSALCAEDKSKDEKPVAAASGYQALMAEYRNALKESDAIFHKAKTDEERQRIRVNFQK